MPKITLAQFESKLCDPPANVAKTIPMIRQAGLDGSDMIMFPEMFTTGYELSIVGPRITELAEPVNGPTITALREAAKQAGVYVVAPIALYHDDLPGVPFNSAVLIDREGNVAGVYDKQHLWALERFYFRGGNGTPVFQTDFGTIGIMIWAIRKWRACLPCKGLRLCFARPPGASLTMMYGTSTYLHEHWRTRCSFVP